MAAARPIAFESCHAAVPTALFAGVVALSMLTVHPVLVAVSLAGALAFSLLARGAAATVRGLAWLVQGELPGTGQVSAQDG